MRAGLAVVAAALASSLMAGAAVAKDIPSGGLTVEDVASWLQDQGYKAQIKSDNGKKYVSSASDGVGFQVNFYDCKNDRCASIQFAAAWATHGHFDTSKMNDWNRDERWARGFYDSAKDPYIQYDVDLSPGGTYEGLKDQFNIWNQMLSTFVKRYGL